MRSYLLYISENQTVEVTADTYRHEGAELVFSLNSEVVARYPAATVLCIDEIKPEDDPR